MPSNQIDKINDKEAKDNIHNFYSTWLNFLFCVVFSAIGYFIIFEWDRYSNITGQRLLQLDWWDQLLFSWLMVSKTLSLFIPVLAFLAILLVFGFIKSARTCFYLFWVFIFYVMTVDLVSLNFAGYHIWDYLPNLSDILRNPRQNIWQWAGDTTGWEALIVLVVFAIFGFFIILISAKLIAYISERRATLVSPKWIAINTLTLFLTVFSVIPLLSSFNDKACLDRVLDSLPLTPSGKNFLDVWAYDSNSLTSAAHAEFQPVDVHERLTERIQGEACPPGNATLPYDEILRNKNTTDFYLESNRIQAGIHRPFPFNIEPTAIKATLNAFYPLPVDCTAFIKNKKLPNIVLVIFESLRPEAISQSIMKRLDSWAETGLRFTQHYSGSNCSHLGLFSLFYGRNALGYDEHFKAKIPPQLLTSLRMSGYEISFLTSGETKGFRRVDKFLNEEHCDNIITKGQFVKGMQDWPESDRMKLDHVKSVLNEKHDKPQFIFFYLLSSHYRYAFPEEFSIYPESSSLWHFLDPEHQIQNHKNRYTNALLYLEHELMQLVDNIDPKNNIIMITGDHGESMGEDGVFTHGSRLSDVQMRVPFVMAGGGIESKKIVDQTSHIDVLPTLMHILADGPSPIHNCDGRDAILQPNSSETILVPAVGPAWNGFMMLKNGKRLLYRINNSVHGKPTVGFDGIVDQFGNYELKIGPNGKIRYAITPQS